MDEINDQSYQDLKEMLRYFAHGEGRANLEQVLLLLNKINFRPSITAETQETSWSLALLMDNLVGQRGTPRQWKAYRSDLEKRTADSNVDVNIIKCVNDGLLCLSMAMSYPRPCVAALLFGSLNWLR